MVPVSVIYGLENWSPPRPVSVIYLGQKCESSSDDPRPWVITARDPAEVGRVRSEVAPARRRIPKTAFRRAVEFAVRSPRHLRGGSVRLAAQHRLVAVARYDLCHPAL